jgi:hypothetical protein
MSATVDLDAWLRTVALNRLRGGWRAVGAPGPGYSSEHGLIDGWVDSGDTGSLAAWFDFTTGTTPDLVVPELHGS